MQTADLDGDGQQDYLVDLRYIACPTRSSAYEGTGGFPLTILVTRSNGLVPVFMGTVRGYRLSAGASPRTITFDLHGSICGRNGAAECRVTQPITGQPMVWEKGR